MRVVHRDVFGFVRVLFVEPGAPEQLRWVQSWTSRNTQTPARPYWRLTFSNKGLGMTTYYVYYRPAAKPPKRLTYTAHPH